MALSVRLANLPNLAKLELVKSESARLSAEVSVILHLDSGKRLQHTFPPSATLWQVIEHWRQTRWVNSGCRLLYIQSTCDSIVRSIIVCVLVCTATVIS